MKDKIRYKGKIRKKQLAKTEPEPNDNCGVSDESFDRMKSKISEIGGFTGDLIRDSSVEKMSEILLKYAEPFIEAIDTDKKPEYEKAIQISIMLWNFAVMQEDPKSYKEVKKMLKPLMPDAESKSIVKHMLDRKRLMYPNNKRLIMNYEITETQDGFNLSVASTMPEGYTAQ